MVIAIPKSGNAAHVKENAVALSLALTSEELQALDAVHATATLRKEAFSSAVDVMFANDRGYYP